MSRRILFFFGPPASGKGTQAERLAEQLGLPAISTGDLLRRNNQLAGEYKAAMNEGQLVADEVINELLVARLGQADAEKGFILDGYPRTKTQFEYFYNNGQLDKNNIVICQWNMEVRLRLIRSTFKSDHKSQTTRLYVIK